MADVMFTASVLFFLNRSGIRTDDYIVFRYIYNHIDDNSQEKIERLRSLTMAR